MIEVVSETGSTNADLAARLRGGERVREGDWLVADRQTAGRGRQGRQWLDGHGNFMGSTVVRLRGGEPQPASLALVAGIAVHAAVSSRLPADRTAILKWPNDVIVGHAKLAGILLERVEDAVIVGIGVNLSSAPPLPDRAAAALTDSGGHLTRDQFARDLASGFELEVQRWRDYGLAPIIARWLAVAHAPGTALRVHEPGGETVEGSFAGLDEAGGLQLRLADGTTRAIHAGDVLLAENPN